MSVEGIWTVGARRNMHCVLSEPRRALGSWCAARTTKKPSSSITASMTWLAVTEYSAARRRICAGAGAMRVSACCAWRRGGGVRAGATHGGRQTC